MNLRSGRFEGGMTNEAAVYTSSLEFDRRIFWADVKCNIAHTTMLKEQKIIKPEHADQIIQALQDLENEGPKALKMDDSIEDIHMAVEAYVTEKIGDVAGFMHTAKSRNDQVATDLRLALREEIKILLNEILFFIDDILPLATDHLDSVMVAYTHLQHAQPTTFAHHLLSYAQALKRDYERLNDAYKRVDLCPLGAAALTTTSFPINRDRTAELLGFKEPLENSLDAVSSRDFISETLSALAILGVNLSRICEELIIWSSYEFQMIEIGDEYSSTSSIMPQKKNPDVAEIARAKSATITGELVTVLTINKSLPQSYNRDLQEISPHLWRAVDTAHDTINITRNMIGSVEFKKDRGQYLARSNFSTATELADLMVREKNIPFRLAHQIVGRAVSISLERGMKAEDMTNVFLDEISIEIIGKPLKLDETLIEQALDPHKVVESRKVTGGPSPEMVKNAINNLKLFIENSS